MSVVIRHVIIAPKAQKQLRKVPAWIADKLDTWVDAVEREGLEEVTKHAY